MSNFTQQIKNDMKVLIQEWMESDFLEQGNFFVVGCSTSEVAGKRIGSSGSEEIAALIYEPLAKLAEEKGIHLVFQCCEHLNRALVVEKKAIQPYDMDVVTVIPVPEAGGSMSSYAFKHMKEPVIVETIEAHAGIDIGDTLIGMQLKRVAIPLRLKQKMVGNARLTAARTRPKLIGGARAQY